MHNTLPTTRTAVILDHTQNVLETLLQSCTVYHTCSLPLFPLPLFPLPLSRLHPDEFSRDRPRFVARRNKDQWLLIPNSAVDLTGSSPNKVCGGVESGVYDGVWNGTHSDHGLMPTICKLCYAMCDTHHP